MQRKRKGISIDILPGPDLSKSPQSQTQDTGVYISVCMLSSDLFLHGLLLLSEIIFILLVPVMRPRCKVDNDQCSQPSPVTPLPPLISTSSQSSEIFICLAPFPQSHLLQKNWDLFFPLLEIKICSL